MERYACDVIVQHWSQFADENAFLDLEQVRVTFPSDKGKILTINWSCSAIVRFYVLEGCIDYHSTQGLSGTSR